MSNTKLFSALLSAQKAFGKVLKESVNPHLKNKYAALDSVLDAVRDPLLEAGIILLQPAVDTGERDEHGNLKVATVRTILVHAESGESYEVQTSIPIPKNDAQGFGSAVTYARRYALLGLLGLAPEDDDGNAASSSGGNRASGQQSSGQQQRTQQRAPAQQPRAAEAAPANAGATDAAHAKKLAEAIETVRNAPLERLDYLSQRASLAFTGEDMKKVLGEIEKRRQELTQAA